MNFSDFLAVTSIIIAGLAYWNTRRQHIIITNPSISVRPRLERLTELYSFDGSIDKSVVNLGSRIEIDIRNDDLSTRVTALNILLRVQTKLGWFDKRELLLYSSEVEYLEPRDKITIINWYADEEFIGYLEMALLDLRPSMLHKHPELSFTRQPPNTPFILDENMNVVLIFEITYQPALFGVKPKKIVKKIEATPIPFDTGQENLIDSWTLRELN